MKKVCLASALFLLFACNNDSELKPAADAQEAAREFVRAALDGNYDKASFYLYHDSAGENEMLLNKWRTDYGQWSQEDKVGHKNASIIVITTQTLPDSSLNFIYSNNYRKDDTTTIHVVKANGNWQVNLKDIHK